MYFFIFIIIYLQLVAYRLNYTTIILLGVDKAGTISVVCCYVHLPSMAAIHLCVHSIDAMLPKVSETFCSQLASTPAKPTC